MSPPALALAVLLHVVVALALWWMSLNRPDLPPAEEAIEVTVEQPKPPEPPPQPEQAPQPPPPPLQQGLSPPAPLTSDRPTQVPPAPEQPKAAPAPSPPPLQEATPAPQPQPPPQEHAFVAPPPRPPPPAPRPELQPSPLTPAPQRRPPAAAPAEPPSAHPFVNPADAYARARISDNYLWQVIRKLQGYSYHANVTARQGLTVVRVVIARDGRLLDVDVTQSSGVPEFDRGVIAGVRAGSPYAPLPPDIKGASATFTLPLISVNRQ